jgi:hypothetical protein
MTFYTYIWMRSTDTSGWPISSPYYVGKGCGDRAFDQADHRLKVPKDPKYIQIIPCRDEESAFETEKFLIIYYGRKDLGTGCLRNLTVGGEGMASKDYSPEVRAKMSKAHMGNKNAIGHSFTPSFEQCSKGAEIAKEKQVGIFTPGFDRTKGLREERAKLSSEEMKARATFASHSIPIEQRKENGRIGQIKSNHVRHHVKRGTVSPTCKFCK